MEGSVPKTLRTIFLFTDAATMAYSVILFFITFSNDPWYFFRLGGVFFGFGLITILIKSVLGMILFLVSIFRKGHAAPDKKSLPLLVPSFLLSAFLVYTPISIRLNNLYGAGMIAPSFILAAGLPLWLYFWLCGKWKIEKTAPRIVYSILTPAFSLVQYMYIWGLIGF